MQTRLWPYILLGITAGGVAAVLAAMEEPFWVVFASVLVFIVVFAFLKEKPRDKDDEGDVEVLESAKPMPTGFGRAMLEQMPLALLVISRRGRVVYGNRAAKEILPKFKAGDHFATLLQVPVFVDAVN